MNEMVFENFRFHNELEISTNKRKLINDFCYEAPGKTTMGECFQVYTRPKQEKISRFLEVKYVLYDKTSPHEGNSRNLKIFECENYQKVSEAILEKSQFLRIAKLVSFSISVKPAMRNIPPKSEKLLQKMCNFQGHTK